MGKTSNSNKQHKGNLMLIPIFKKKNLQFLLFFTLPISRCQETLFVNYNLPKYSEQPQAQTTS